MLEKLKVQLLVTNLIVFGVLLGVFSGSVYWAVKVNTHLEAKRRLETIAKTLTASIESPDQDEPRETVPDIFQSRGEQNSRSDLIGLQWFDPDARLRASKGVAINAPFVKNSTFDTQANPHCLLQTEPVIRKKELIGYLRVALSVEDSDRFNKQLEQSLVFGVFLTLLLGSMAVLWLVRQALRPVEKSIEQLSTFTSDASHELKGPLTAVSTNTDVVLKYSENLTADDKERLEAVMQATHQIQSTVGDLLALATHEQDSSNRVVTEIDITRLFKELQVVLATFAQAKNVSLICEVEGGLGSTTQCRDDLTRMLLNLLRNAIQYSTDGGRVTLKARPSGNKIIFEVRDSGIGIATDDLPKIYDRFWRADKARSHASGGNGLGLSIVQAIVKRNGGKISVESALGQGTAFTVILPNQTN